MKNARLPCAERSREGDSQLNKTRGEPTRLLKNLEIFNSLLTDGARLAQYQPHWAARAGLLERTGQTDAADHVYERAIGLEADPAVREFLQGQRARLRDRS